MDAFGTASEKRFMTPLPPVTAIAARPSVSLHFHLHDGRPKGFIPGYLRFFTRLPGQCAGKP
jgi:hypothetical protein